MPYKKEHYGQIVALAYIAGVCALLIVAGLVLVFARDLLEQARWYESAAKIYTAQAYQSANIPKKNALLLAAKESQRRALEAQPFDVVLWRGMEEILRSLHEGAAQAEEIAGLLSKGPAPQERGAR